MHDSTSLRADAAPVTEAMSLPPRQPRYLCMSLLRVQLSVFAAAGKTQYAPVWYPHVLLLLLLTEGKEALTLPEALCHLCI